MILNKISNIIGASNLFSLNTYFPKSYNLLEQDIKLLYNSKIFLDPTENKYHNSKIKNLNLEIYVYNSKIPNAMTFPGVNDINILNNNLNDLYVLGLQILHKHPLSAVRKKDILEFKSDIKNFKLIVFVSSGFIKLIKNPEDRFAIILHEIGHWVHINNLLLIIKLEDIIKILTPSAFIITAAQVFNPYDTIFKISTLIPYIALITLKAVVNFKNQQDEYDSDLFVKQLGYSENLQNALSLLSYKKPISKINIKEKATLVNNIIEILMLIYSDRTHPSTYKRILALQESETTLFNLKDWLSLIDILIKQNNGIECKLL